MRIFVTGANGFLGSRLLQEFARAGHEVHGSARPDVSRVPLDATRRHALSLGDTPAPELFDGFDAVVHAAHDLAADAYERNVDGTRLVARAARNAGVGRQLFLGSYSAHEQAAGAYGRAKWALECQFLEWGEIVLKPGLVIGAGGLFARLLASTRRTRLVPLPGGGHGEVPVVGLRDTLAATCAVLEEGTPGVQRLYLEQRVPLRALVDEMLTASGTRALRLPLPLPALHALLRVCETLGIDAPIGRDSLMAFSANQSVRDASDLGRWIPHPQSLAEMVRDALAESPA